MNIKTFILLGGNGDANSCASTDSGSVDGFILFRFIYLRRRGQLPFSLIATAVNFPDVISSALKQLFLHREEFLLLPSRPELLVLVPAVCAQT